MKFEKLNEIFEIIEQRKNSASSYDSYVARLKEKGIDAVLKKIGEESAEVIMAAKDKNKKELVHEVVDLLFHTLVLINFEGIRPQEIAKEFTSRHISKSKK